MPRITPDAAGGQNVCAFLDLIGYSEDTSTRANSDDGYNVIVGGTLFPDYSQHPRIAIKTPWGWSDAAGRYQFMAAIPNVIRTDTWDWASRACKVPDFSPLSQDLVAIYLIRRRGALEDVKAGRIAVAVDKCRKEWASLPGAGYGQREHSVDFLIAEYKKAGGRLS